MGVASYTVNLCFSTWVSKSAFWDTEKGGREGGGVTLNKRLPGSVWKADLEVTARWDFPFMGGGVLVNYSKSASLRWHLALLLPSYVLWANYFISFFVCKMGTVVSCMIVFRIKCDLHVNCLEHYRCSINGCNDTKILIR